MLITWYHCGISIKFYHSPLQPRYDASLHPVTLLLYLWYIFTAQLMSDYLAGLVISSNIFKMTNRFSVEIITAPCHRVGATSRNRGK